MRASWFSLLIPARAQRAVCGLCLALGPLAVVAADASATTNRLGSYVEEVPAPSEAARLLLIDQMLTLEDSAAGGLIRRCVLLAGDRRFAFLPPQDWIIPTERGQARVVLSEPERRALLILRFIPQEIDLTTDWRSAVRADVQERHPKLKLRSETTLGSGRGEALALDLTAEGSGQGRMAVRAVVIPQTGGVLDFELTTQVGYLDAAYAALRKVLKTISELPVNGTL